MGRCDRPSARLTFGAQQTGALAEVIKRHPATVPVFLALGCLDMRHRHFKLMSQQLSARNAARIHQLEPGPLIEDSNKAAEARNGRSAIDARSSACRLRADGRKLPYRSAE